MSVVNEIEAREREKYWKAWSYPEYRERSPGLRAAPAVHAFFTTQPNTYHRMEWGDSLIDYGCGTGRAAVWFQDSGLKVLGIDLIREAVEEDIPFLQACLWHLPWCVPVSDWAYVCDIMEHMPEVYVQQCLTVIAKHTRKGAFFNVANNDSDCHGTELHCTKLSFDEWLHRISVHFNILHHEPGDRDGNYRIYCGARQ